LEKKTQKFKKGADKVKRSRDHRKVTMSQYSELVRVETNFDLYNPESSKLNLEIYTIDADFMVKVWDVSLRGADHLSYSEVAGKCKESIIIKPCDRYHKLKTAADKFKDEYSRGAENFGAIKRSIFSCCISDKETNKKRPN